MCHHPKGSLGTWMTPEEAIVTKSKRDVFGQQERQTDAHDAVHLQTRKSFSFPNMISILILGIGFKIYTANYELNCLFKRWSSRLTDVEIKINYNPKRGEKSRDP